MRKLLLIAGLLISVLAQAQRTRYIILDSLLGPPADTFRVPTQYRNLPFLAARHDSVYVWDKDAHYWKPVGGGGGSTELADQGLTKSGVNIRLGDPVGSTSSIFSASRQIATDTFYLAFQGKALAGFPNYPNRIQLRLSDGTTHGQQLNFLGSGSINNYMYYGTGSHSPGINFLSGDRNATLTAMGYHYTAGQYHPFIDMRDSTLYFGIEDNGLSLANFIRSFNGGGSVTQLGLRGKTVFGATLTHDQILADVDNVGSTMLRDSVSIWTLPSVSSTDSVLVKSGLLIKAIAQSSISSNIGNSDLTLSGNRVLSGASKTLNFDSLGSFWANTKTLSNQQGTIYFNESQSLIESRNNSTGRAAGLETASDGTIEFTSSLSGNIRSKIFIQPDSINLIYNTAPTSSSMTGHRPIIRNTSSGALNGFTGTFGINYVDSTVFIPVAQTSVITGTKVFSAATTYFRPASDNQDNIDFLNAAGTLIGSFGTYPSAPTYLAGYGSGSHTTTSYWFAYNNSQLLLNAPSDLYLRIGNTTLLNVFSTGVAIGNGATQATAKLHLGVGTTSAGSAPIKLTTASAALNTTPVTGQLEVDSAAIYYTSGIGTNLIRRKMAEWGYRAVTATYSALVNDNTIEVTSGTFTITLPSAVGIANKLWIITNSGSGVVTVSTSSSQTFVNVTATPTTLTLNQFGTVTIQSNGANMLRLTSL